MHADERDDFVSRARGLAPLLEAQSLANEKASTLTPEVVDALRSKNLFWLLVPKDLGGSDVEIATYLETIEEIAAADGSTGWALMTNAFSLGIASAHCSDAAVEKMFGGGARPIAASQAAPSGKLKVADGGFVASGHWKFGSGCAHADWLGGGAVLLDGDQPKKNPDGSPMGRMCWFPHTDAEIIRKWDVLGMNGTGSFEYTVTERFLPEGFSHDWNQPPLRGRHFLGFGLMGVAFAGHAAVALGLMKRALRELARLPPIRKRAKGYLIGDNPLFQADFSRNEATYRAARALIHAAYREASAAVAARGKLAPVELEHLRQAMIWAHETGSDLVKSCWTWAGSDGLQRPGIMERCMRDMLTISAHGIVDSNNFVTMAPALLGEWREATK